MSSISFTKSQKETKLKKLFLETRLQTEALCQDLALEDYGIQTMLEVSPPKWHLAHTTWFFEDFLLKKYLANYKPYHPQFSFLFNSYYKSNGKHLKQSQRSFLSRPLLDEVWAYRNKITSDVQELWDLENCQIRRNEFEKIICLGIHHEKQHQELMLADIKYNFYQNPLHPSFNKTIEKIEICNKPFEFLDIEGGVSFIGYEAEDGFCYDNEKPRHRIYLNDYKIANRLVNCGEFLNFIEDGAYHDFRYWLADAWNWLQMGETRREAPLYWEKKGGEYHVFTLGGFKTIEKLAPVSHLSYYEAMAYAKWADKRLATEGEWEIATRKLSDSSFDFMGHLWQWTTSNYTAYPGYRSIEGALGEYNAKFMCDQMVLRGGSWATSSNHLRPTYRNYWQADKSWQFTGLRLAEDSK